MTTPTHPVPTRVGRRRPRLLALLLTASLLGCVGVESTDAPSPSERATVAPTTAPTATATATPIPTPNPTPVPSPTTPPTPTPSVAPTATPPASSAPSPSPTSVPIASLVGQKLVVALTGTTADAAILARIRAGQVGGVILFGFNIVDAAQLRALTASLQAAASAGGQPPLLIATDQEGGSIKRVPWIPPSLSPPEIGATGDPSVARSQGLATGTALAALGINVDLAPVADLPFSSSSILYRQGRTFSLDPDLNAELVDAFADGLRAGGVLPVLKHFPGLGWAEHNTDDTVVTLDIGMTGLGPGLLPYRDATVAPVVMLSNAVYTQFDAQDGAGWAPSVAADMLRDDLGFRGVSMTDSLSGAAHARGVTEASLAVLAAIAGTDIVLVTDSEATTPATYAALLAAARDGTIPQGALMDSYTRILALKATLP